MSELLEEGRRFPILTWGRQYGDPAWIPWELAEEAYAEYSRQHGTEQSLVRLGERGGFSVKEMDAFIPNWRAKASAIYRLKEAVVRLQNEVERLQVQLTDREAAS